MKPVPPFLKVRTINGNLLVRTDEILYIEGFDKHSFIYFVSNPNHRVETFHLLKWYCRHLPDPEFCRCHNSFIVNCRYIEYHKSNEFVLNGNVGIPVSRRLKNNALNAYYRYFAYSFSGQDKYM